MPFRFTPSILLRLRKSKLAVLQSAQFSSVGSDSRCSSLQPYTTSGRTPIPDRVRKLFLAFHDGQRWHNNGGQVSATITWVPAVNALMRRGF